MLDALDFRPNKKRYMIGCSILKSSNIWSETNQEKRSAKFQTCANVHWSGFKSRMKQFEPDCLGWNRTTVNHPSRNDRKLRESLKSYKMLDSRAKSRILLKDRTRLIHELSHVSRSSSLDKNCTDWVHFIDGNHLTSNNYTRSTWPEINNGQRHRSLFVPSPNNFKSITFFWTMECVNEAFTIVFQCRLYPFVFLFFFFVGVF